MSFHLEVAFGSWLQLLAALLEPFSSHLFRGSSTSQHPHISSLYPTGSVKGPASRVLELAMTARLLCVLG